MNPLTSSRVKPPASAPDPMLRHAQLWQHMNSMDGDALKTQVAAMDYGLPIIGKLAGDPNVKAKDVIKAVSSAVADGHMQPSIAVATISDMPADTDKLRPWLRARYSDNLSAVVHAKAALLAQPQPQGQPQGQPAPAPGPAAPAPVAPAPGGPVP